MTPLEKALPFYEVAKQYCIQHGYEWELKLVRERSFKDVDAEQFFLDYVFVVLNAGMKNQVAQKIYERFLESKLDTSVIRHEGKRKAIETALAEYKNWYCSLTIIYSHMYNPGQNGKTINDVLEYLESLPWVGGITRYHLARNLGFDVAKPDRHLVRLCAMFGYKDVQEMCESVSKKTEDRVGLVDVILWRYINLTGIPSAV